MGKAVKGIKKGVKAVGKGFKSIFKKPKIPDAPDPITEDQAQAPEVAPVIAPKLAEAAIFQRTLARRRSGRRNQFRADNNALAAPTALKTLLGS